MDSYELTLKVDETQKFIEIANNFTNPLDLVKEAFSNAFYVKAEKYKNIF